MVNSPSSIHVIDNFTLHAVYLGLAERLARPNSAAHGGIEPPVPKLPPQRFRGSLSQQPVVLYRRLLSRCQTDGGTEVPRLVNRIEAALYAVRQCQARGPALLVGELADKPQPLTP